MVSFGDLTWLRLFEVSAEAGFAIASIYLRLKSAVQRRRHLAEARGAESTGVDRNRQESNLSVRRISPPRDAFAAELTFPGFRKVGGEIAKSRVGQTKKPGRQTKKSGRQTKKSSGRSVAGGWTGEIGLVEIPIRLVENRSPACGDFHQACGSMRTGCN